MSAIEWTEPAVNELPTGTVTLLLADVEGSTRLWETQPEVMRDAVERLDATLADVVPSNRGVRPVEQGEGDSFVVAFFSAADAVACALDLQHAALAPIKLRIGIHTGDVQLRDEGNYVGPTINRTARLRDLGHGGQILLSGATELLVVDGLPSDVTLTDLGVHTLRDLPRPERVVQVNHPDLGSRFPALRTPKVVAEQHLPTQLTSFVGRQTELDEVRGLVTANRLVTLTGTGGIGKTRLALQVADAMTAEFAGGAWNVDLAPVPHPDIVPVAVARALNLPDQPGRSTVETIVRFIGDRHMLVILDNCEHLLDASAALVTQLLAGCPGLTLLTTSREPIGVPGEVSWRVPSLSLTDDAIELFADRARRVRADFAITADNNAAVQDICARLDGLPLAIELAAARIRAMSLTDLRDSLKDRFRILTGGSRMAVPRQQTLQASVDWSHELLTEPERMLLRRLAAFLGGFDLDAAQFVCGGGDIARYQILDQLTSLVDKSLVVADSVAHTTRYRLLETVRQYGLEKLGQSGEADTIRSRHRDHYVAMAALLDTSVRDNHQHRVEQAELEMDNLRAALGWCLENSDVETAGVLASSLQPLWFDRGRIREGQAWFDTVFAATREDLHGLSSATRARALADKAVLDMWSGPSLEQAKEALAIARTLDDRPLLLRTLTACGNAAAYSDSGEAAFAYLSEATALARALGDQWRLSHLLAWQGSAAVIAGDPVRGRAATEEGRDIADSVGDEANSRNCRMGLAWAQLMEGDVAASVAQFRQAADECEAAHDVFLLPTGLQGLGTALAYHGEPDAARDAGNATVRIAVELGDMFLAMGYTALQYAELAMGDIPAARTASTSASENLDFQPHVAAVQRARSAEISLLSGDIETARAWADEAITSTTGWHRAAALITRSRVALVDGHAEEAANHALDALDCAISSHTFLVISDVLELLAAVSAGCNDRQRAARLFGSAAAIRERSGIVRFKVYDADHSASVSALRDTLGDNAFDAAWAEGAAMSIKEAIAYALRGRGERKRPSTGWASLTPAELDVTRLVAEGLTNKDVAARLFISPRTVQAHLAHVFAKLGVSTRTQLAQEASSHA